MTIKTPKINYDSVNTIAKEAEFNQATKSNEILLLGVIHMLTDKISKETGLGENDSSQLLLHILISKEFSEKILDEIKDKDKIMDLFRAIQKDNCFKISNDYSKSKK